MEALQIFSAVKDVALAGAAIVTATVAIKGLNRWRNELRGKVDFETARDLVRATYKLRDELQYARSPLIRGSEFPESYTPNSASPDEEAQAWAHVYGNRWRPVAEAAREFDAQALEAEALWGAEIREAANKLRHCAHQLYVSMDAVIEDKLERGENFRTDKEFGRKVRADVSGSLGASDNPLSKKIADAIEILESKLRKHLSRG